MNDWWAEINDYLGIACWQQRQGYPQWQALAETLSIARIDAVQSWIQRDGQPLEQDGDYAGRRYGDLFIASRAASEATPWPSLLLTELSASAPISYLIGWLADEQGQPQLALALRLRPEQPFFYPEPLRRRPSPAPERPHDTRLALGHADATAGITTGGSVYGVENVSAAC